ncbi:hypothetical protein CYLTODRAFT_478796, partial [Cylindrobasidium torrendii FP15055 ss-10]
LTGRKIYGDRRGENSQLSHIAHQQIEYLDFFRLSEAIGVKYLNPHSTGNVLESLVDVHNLYNQLRDILLPPKEDLERFRDFVLKNLDLIKEGKPPINIFEAEGFDKLRLWDYEFTCLLRETPLHVFFNEDGTLILDQISNPGRQIEMPAHGYMIRGIPTHIVFVFLGSAYALNHHKKSAKVQKTMSESQRERAKIIQDLAQDIGLFKKMTAKEYIKLQDAGFAPRNAASFKKLTGGKRLYLMEDDYEVEVKFDPKWKPESELLPGPDEADTSFEDAQDHPAEEYGISSLERAERLQDEPPTKKQRYTSEAKLELGRERREQKKQHRKEKAKMRALHPDVHRDSSSPDNDTPSKPPMKRRLGGPPPDDPFVSDEDIERPRKKARFAEDPTTPSAPAQNPAPAATTRPPRRRLVFPAAMQEPRYRTSQAVAGP